MMKKITVLSIIIACVFSVLYSKECKKNDYQTVKAVQEYENTKEQGIVEFYGMYRDGTWIIAEYDGNYPTLTWKTFHYSDGQKGVDGELWLFSNDNKENRLTKVEKINW